MDLNLKKKKLLAKFFDFNLIFFSFQSDLNPPKNERFVKIVKKIIRLKRKYFCCFFDFFFVESLKIIYMLN